MSAVPTAYATPDPLMESILKTFELLDDQTKSWNVSSLLASTVKFTWAPTWIWAIALGYTIVATFTLKISKTFGSFLR
jgi:hypothetical protein